MNNPVKSPEHPTRPAKLYPSAQADFSPQIMNHEPSFRLTGTPVDPLGIIQSVTSRLSINYILSTPGISPPSTSYPFRVVTASILEVTMNSLIYPLVFTPETWLRFSDTILLQ